ncbi:glycosyl hydrolase family 28 protein [Sphingomonas sp. DT-207]|uniref:glycosyl hydrolase family 28 protein n=1 Tax=Sphingomonas sp. DT-207 TaxID=3396167 RepID=UPI003F1B8562
MFSLALAWAMPAAAQMADGKLHIHEFPQGKAFWSHLNDDFTVRVRSPGGEWRDLYEYIVRIDSDRPQNASMVFFDIGGPVEVAVKKNNGDVRRVQVRPDSAGVQARLAGNTVYFTLQKPAKISVEFDGDRLNNLHLFANPMETGLPISGPDVIYFGPGVHSLPEGQKSFKIPSNKTVVISGGALVQGMIEVREAENVRIVGHGILEGGQEGVLVAHSRNVTIDGPIVLNPKHYTVQCGQSTGVTIRELKAFSVGSWTDGIDLMSCSDVEIDGVFLRNSDDTIAIYGGRGEYRGDARNYRITNSILWADIAHPINIGLHGTPGESEVIENISFRDIDVLGHDEDDREYQGVMAITDGDNNRVRNIRFEDIRIDDIQEGMLFNLRVVFNGRYSHAPGGGIEDVVIRNVRFKGGDINRPVISGHSENRRVRRVTIENVTVAGKRLKRSDIAVGPFVDDLVVR